MTTIQEYCTVSGADPGTVKRALAHERILKEENGRFSPGERFESAGASTRVATSPSMGRTVRLMEFPEGVLTAALVRASATSARVSLSAFLKVAPEAALYRGEPLSRKQIASLLRARGVIGGGATLGPNAALAGATLRESGRDGKSFSYVAYSEKALRAFLAEELSKEDLDIPKEERPGSDPKALLTIGSDARIAVFDTETTGFNEKKEDLLQITIVEGTIGDFASGSPMVALSTYVRPEKRTSWPEAEAVNRISPTMVSAPGVPSLSAIAPKVVEAFMSADLVVGHNVSFDAKFVKEKFGYAIPVQKRADTLTLSRHLLKGLPNHKLATVVGELLPNEAGEFSSGAHSAEVDTIFTAKVLGALAERFPDRIVTEAALPLGVELG